MKDAGFSKDERLKKKTAIEALLKSGNRIGVGQVILIWARVEGPRRKPVKILVAVPKKKFKKATDRNLLKRRIREAYRRNKQKYITHMAVNNIYADMMFLYKGEHILTYTELEQKIVLLLNDLMRAHA